MAAPVPLPKRPLIHPVEGVDFRAGAVAECPDEFVVEIAGQRLAVVVVGVEGARSRDPGRRLDEAARG
jgi:hypothetical protein